jgi:hypothetical protein
MKKIAVHCIVDPAEVAWAKQFAGEDAAVRKQFPAAPFGVRGRAAIPAVSWESIVSTIEKAAVTAGCGGWIGLVSGHGGSGCSHEDVLVPMCPVSSRRVATVYLDPHKRISFNQVTVFYKESPGPPSKSQQENDQDVLSCKIAGNKKVAQARLNTRKFYERIGVALASNRLRRLAFLVCNIGASTAFMDQIATDWGVDVAAFKFRTACGFDTGNKARLWLNRDSKDGQGTNTMAARVFSPSLDDPNIAYVARPRGINIWERVKNGSCPSPRGNVWERVKAAGGTQR